MQNQPAHPSLDGISSAHGDIIAHLFQLSGLQTQLPMKLETRQFITQTMAFFQRTVLAHHSAEETHLFPTVLAQAMDGPEREYVQTLVSQLTAEHRSIEALWASLERALQALLDGRYADALDSLVQTLVLDYGDHATKEEVEFLPLCREILGRAHRPFDEAALLHPAPRAQVSR